MLSRDRALQADKRAEETGDQQRSVLGVVLERYYAEHASKKASRVTSRISIGKWKKFFGGIIFADLTPVRQERFIQWLKDQENSVNYIRRILSLGQSALRRAVKRQELASAPPILLPKKVLHKKYRMTKEEAAALFNAAVTPHFRTFLMLAFGTAQRPINILELTTDRMDLQNRLIDFNPPSHEENNKRRPVVAICDALLSHLKTLPAGFAVRWKKNQTKPIGGIKTAFAAAKKASRSPQRNHAVHDKTDDCD